MRRLSSLLALTLVLAHPAAAQTTGSVRGVAMDQQSAAIPGVVISATSPTVPGSYEATTDHEGRYRLANLPPGDYTIVGVIAGFSRFQRSPITVRAGLNIDVDLVMTVGSIDETVHVTQDTPLIESRSALRAVNISGELQRSMPLTERREWFGALTLAPGVTTAEWVNNEKLFYVNGADSSANVVQIDGADVSAILSSGLGYISLNTDAIDDIQIKTAGVDASSPLGVGGIVNIATASGTNRLKGTASLFVQPRAWNDSNTPGGTSATVDQRQIDASVGAPLIKDRFWVFGAYRFTDVVNGVSRTAAQLDTLKALVPGFAPFDATNEAQFWFIKLSAQPSPRHQLSGFYQYDVNPVTFAEAITANARAEDTGGTGLSFRASSVWSNVFTTKFAISYNDKGRNGRPPDGSGPLERVFQGTIASGGRLAGNGRLADRGSPVSAINDQPFSNLTISFDGTYFAESGVGTHELQAGVYLQPKIHVVLGTHYVNDGTIFIESVLRRPGTSDWSTIPFHQLIIDGTDILNVKRRGQDYAFYVQDAWRPTGRLTINAGVRVDRVAWTDELFDVTSQRSTEIGPRFGVNYLLTEDARNVVRAHWVRVHDLPARTTTGVGTVALGQRDLYDLDLDGTFETTFVTPPTVALTPNRTIDSDLHQPFIDEWGTGYSRQLGGNTMATVSFVNRKFLDRPTFLETNGVYQNNMFVGYADERVNEIYKVTNNRWNWPVFRSIELSLTKRTARLEGIASYVRQFRHIDGTWQPNDPASFIQPDAFSNDAGIGSTIGSTGSPSDANSLSGSNMTQRSTGSGQWQDHVVRLGVTYRAPWEILLSTSYTFQSGSWSGPIVSRVAAADPAFGPPVVTLSNGRTVTNPLSTLFRFAYPTRGDNQLTTPDLNAWNVRFGRRFGWRAVKLDVALDVFNVTNNGADGSFNSGANQTFNPLFGTTTFRQLPRSAQLVIRTWF